MYYKDYIFPPLPSLDEVVAKAAKDPANCSIEELQRALTHWSGKELRWLCNNKEAHDYNITEVWDEIARIKDIIKRRRAAQC